MLGTIFLSSARADSVVWNKIQGEFTSILLNIIQHSAENTKKKKKKIIYIPHFDKNH